MYIDYIEPTPYTDDTNVVQSPRLNEPSITSHVGLNRLQTQFIIDNIFNDDILTTLEVETDENNVFGVFLMGDMNNGELLSRCEYLDDEGNNNADNCELPDDAPLNPYKHKFQSHTGIRNLGTLEFYMFMEHSVYNWTSLHAISC